MGYNSDTQDFDIPVHTLPILLNIPSLKEKINVSTRKYSINSINIDISNFPYEGGERFSDLIADSSIINT